MSEDKLEKEGAETTQAEKDPASLNSKCQTFEDTLEAIGGFGRFQVLVLTVLLFPEIPSAFVLFIPVFLAKLPSQPICNLTLTSNSSSPHDLCSEANANATTFSFWDESTIITEWNLTGDQSWVSDFMNSVQMFGMLIGSIFISQLSDWSGRKLTYFFICILMILGQIISALSFSPIIFGFARFIGGIGVAGFMGMGTVYPMEFLTPKWRLLCASVGPWGEGIMILAVLAYFIPNWRILTLITTIPFVTTIALYWVPESPKWLLRNNKLLEARTILMSIAKVNGIKYFEIEKDALNDMAEAETQGNSKSKFSYLSFFRMPELRRKSVVLTGIWLTYATVYYGLNYNVKNMSGNLYLNMFLMGLSDAIGYPLALLFNNRFGRRRSLIVFMGFAAALLVVLTVLDSVLIMDELIVAGICLLAKIGFAGARSSTRLLTGESYPTPIRTMAFGICGVGAGIGGIIAPQIVYLGTTWWSGLPFLFFSIMSVIGAVLSLLLPETAGKALQEQMGRPTGEVKLKD